MPSDLLDDGIIKMPGVTQEIPSDVICVLDTLEDIGGKGELSSFSELCSYVLALEVDILDPGVVIGGSSLGNVFLEDNDVGIGNLDRVR